MRRGLVVAVACLLAGTAAAQARRPQPKAFPVSITGALALNSYGIRAQEQDVIVLQCVSLDCVEHGFGKGPGFGVEIQVPIAGNVGFAVGVDGVTMLRRQCILGGNCVTSDRVFGLRARGQFLLRLKARAPIYFGLGAAVMRNSPGSLLPQVDPTIDVGGVFTIGGDFAAGPRTTIRVAWHSYLLKADDTGLPANYAAGTSHDAVITIGARVTLLP